MSLDMTPYRGQPSRVRQRQTKSRQAENEMVGEGKPKSEQDVHKGPVNDRYVPLNPPNDWYRRVGPTGEGRTEGQLSCAVPVKGGIGHHHRHDRKLITC